MKLPHLIIDGPDGVGKTTIRQALAHRLEELGFTVIEERQPGGTIVGEKLRDLLLNPDVGIDPYVQAMMFLASRLQAEASLIKPSIEAGKVVLSDRGTYSTRVYQPAMMIESMLKQGISYKDAHEVATELRARIDALLELDINQTPGLANRQLVLLLDAPSSVLDARRPVNHRDRFEGTTALVRDYIRAGYREFHPETPTDNILVLNNREPITQSILDSIINYMRSGQLTMTNELADRRLG